MRWQQVCMYCLTVGQVSAGCTAPGCKPSLLKILLLLGFAAYYVAKGVGVGYIAFKLVGIKGSLHVVQYVVVKLKRVVFGNAVAQAQRVGNGFGSPQRILFRSHKGNSRVQVHFAFQQAFAKTKRRAYAKQFKQRSFGVQRRKRRREGKANSLHHQRISQHTVYRAVAAKLRGYFIKII